MRKLLFISGFTWATVFMLSTLFNLLHWPGFHALVMGQGLLLGMVFIPVYLRYRQRFLAKGRIFDIMLLGVGVLTSGMMSFGAIFKTMHWPGANIMMLSSLFLLTLALIPMITWDWYQGGKPLETT